MIALLFLLLLAASAAGWFNQRKTAIYFMSITLLLSLAWFMHHITSTINIQL